VQVHIKHLLDDGQCYQTVRALRWPDGVRAQLVSPHQSSSAALMPLH